MLALGLSVSDYVELQGLNENHGDQNDFIEGDQNYSVASEEKKQKNKDKG